ncbi:hypothetical protein [Streptoalloteichus hindustanus]|uniref:Uncharacterized protein n=1 Tax=Streptoalloteichus hindustanus TaxID=2017 RepID=A0A1M5JD19_STRHI|nr:hypothetical protein [Streptoalloteichus hindustanus]SHG38438.1 hypothetical protein SAMN05444320_108231 [Streptoalloteichus hindustanus]
MSEFLSFTVPGIAAGAPAVGDAAGSACAPPRPSAGGFTIRKDQAPALKAKFEEAIAKLTYGRRQVSNMERLDPLVNEDASVRFADKLNEAALGESGSALRAIDTAIIAYNSVVEQIDKAIGTYRQADDAF